MPTRPVLRIVSYKPRVYGIEIVNCEVLIRQAISGLKVEGSGREDHALLRLTNEAILKYIRDKHEQNLFEGWEKWVQPRLRKMRKTENLERERAESEKAADRALVKKVVAKHKKATPAKPLGAAAAKLLTKRVDANVTTANILRADVPRRLTRSALKG
jgi:hypothetical protein